MAGFVTVTDGPAVRAVVQRQTVKDELGLSGSEYDSKIDRLIAAVSSSFAGADGLGRELWRQTYSENLAGQGGFFLRLGRFPIESVAEVLELEVAVDAAEYSIGGADRSLLYRENGWLFSRNGRRANPSSGAESLDYVVSYVAGWLMPGQVADWRSSRGYSVGDFVRSSAAGTLLVFEATVAGTTGATEPTWPAVAGGTVVDGSVTWTAREGSELPTDIETVGLLQVIDWFRGGLSVPAGILETRAGDVSVKYNGALVESGFALLPAARGVLRGYR